MQHMSTNPLSLRTIFALSLLLVSVTLACRFGAVAVQPPSQSASRLQPQYRLAFERSAQGWLRRADGKNLIEHGVISDPTILYEDGSYRMWFTAAVNPYTDEQELGTAYAESEDGLTWRPRIDPATGEPLLVLRPTPGGWDAAGVETPYVLKNPEGVYLLYYTGTLPPEGSNSWAIGLARSEDGLTWTKVGDKPILEGRGEWEGPFFEGSDENRQQIGDVLEPSILFDDEQNLYRMWYSAMGFKASRLAFRVGYATSPDGLAWERLAGPVLEPDRAGAWDSAAVSHVNVVHAPRSGYHLFYFGASEENYQYAEQNGAAMIPGSIGHAFSPDGISWEKDANPVLSTVPDTWEAWMVGGLSALIQEDQIKLWYFGSAQHDTFEFHLGLATAQLP
jgi:predicted GH43/DUF377 family glycosyl hydrolase